MILIIMAARWDARNSHIGYLNRRLVDLPLASLT